MTLSVRIIIIRQYKYTPALLTRVSGASMTNLHGQGRHSQRLSARIQYKFVYKTSIDAVPSWCWHRCSSCCCCSHWPKSSCEVHSLTLVVLQDLFTTLVDIQWRWTILVFTLSFLLSWFSFACVWWLIAYTHGDLDPENLMPDSGWSPCVDNINSFTSCFLFSLETQHTIGYGGRATTEECPEAVITMCLQSIWGMMIQVLKFDVSHLNRNPASPNSKCISISVRLLKLLKLYCNEGCRPRNLV